MVVFSVMSAPHFKDLCYLASIGHNPLGALVLAGNPAIKPDVAKWVEPRLKPLTELVAVARKTLEHSTTHPDSPLDMIQHGAQVKLTHGMGASLMLQMLIRDTPPLRLLFYSPDVERDEFEAGLRLIIEAFGEEATVTPPNPSHPEPGPTA